MNSSLDVTIDQHESFKETLPTNVQVRRLFLSLIFHYLVDLKHNACSSGILTLPLLLLIIAMLWGFRSRLLSSISVAPLDFGVGFGDIPPVLNSVLIYRSGFDVLYLSRLLSAILEWLRCCSTGPDPVLFSDRFMFGDAYSDFGVGLQVQIQCLYSVIYSGYRLFVLSLALVYDFGRAQKTLKEQHECHFHSCPYPLPPTTTYIQQSFVVPLLLRCCHRFPCL